MRTSITNNPLVETTPLATGIETAVRQPRRIPCELLTSGTIEFLTLVPSANDISEIQSALRWAYGDAWVGEFDCARGSGRDLIQALTLVLLNIVEAKTGYRPTKTNALLIRTTLKRKQHPGT